MKEELESKNWTSVLFFIYGVLLIWIVLFQFEFSFTLLEKIRSIHLIPFHTNFNPLNMIQNIAIFIPVGIYISLLQKDNLWKKKILYLFLISISLELGQFIFSIGITDTTDILCNMIGGSLGILFCTLLSTVIQQKQKVALISNIITTLITILLVAFLITLWIVKG